MTETTPVVDLIDARPIGRPQIVIAAVGALALLCEGFDLQIISYVMPRIVQEWGIERARQGTILSAGYGGMLIGFLALAPLASRIGAKRLAVYCLLAMGALNLATLFATGGGMLVAFRVAVGLTLGGVVPPTLALVAEFFPARRRSALIAMLYLGTTSGIMVAGIVAWLTLARYGWRGAMVVGGVMPIVAAIAVRIVWFESPVWLLARGAEGAARVSAMLERLYPRMPSGRVVAAAEPSASNTGSVAHLFTERRLVGTLMLWLGLSCNAVVYFFALSWMPLILVGIGATQQNAILASTLANLGGLAAIATGFLMDRYGRSRIVIGYFFAGAVFVLLVGVLLSPAVMVIAPTAFCLGYCVSGLQKGVSALAIEFYPPALRSAGVGWVLGVGRSGAILGPMVPGLLMQAGWPPAHVFYLMSIPLVLGGAGIALMQAWYRPRTSPDHAPPHAVALAHDDYPAKKVRAR